MAGEASGKNRTEGVLKVRLFTDAGIANYAPGGNKVTGLARPIEEEIQALESNDQAAGVTGSAALRGVVAQTEAIRKVNNTDPGNQDHGAAGKPPWA
jgi:hypothetical protein